MKIRYISEGICGLSCRLCPNHHTKSKSRCPGCKSSYRMAAGCPFITCALKKKGVESCVLCPDNNKCALWKSHRTAGKKKDSFKCYQTLEADIKFMHSHGISEFDKIQKKREKLLVKMLDSYNEGRSKSYYCIAATVMTPKELDNALYEAARRSKGMKTKEKSAVMHELLDAAAEGKYFLKLRK